jgi:hypothetical protein
MSDLYALVYVSTATQLMTETELEKLLIEVNELNRQNNLTGVLLYNQGDFMQCLEGPEPALRETFKRISASSRHSGVFCLFDERIEQRSFPDWQMGLAKATQSQMLTLSSAHWKKTAQKENGSADSDGLMLLKDFWTRR